MMKDKKQKTFLIYTPEYVKNLPNLNVYAIYPDYWGEGVKLSRTFVDSRGKSITYKTKHNWGEIPCLGYVKETSEFWAEKAAYTANLLPHNVTFGPRAILIKTKSTDYVEQPITRKSYAGKRRNFNK
jgi:hypothetical protein